MKISIYGLGCDKYFLLLDMTKRAIKELNISADIQEIYHHNHFVRDDIIYLPSLSINGKIVIKGAIPSMDKLRSIFIKYSKSPA